MWKIYSRSVPRTGPTNFTVSLSSLFIFLIAFKFHLSFCFWLTVRLGGSFNNWTRPFTISRATFPAEMIESTAFVTRFTFCWAFFIELSMACESATMAFHRFVVVWLIWSLIGVNFINLSFFFNVGLKFFVQNFALFFHCFKGSGFAKNNVQSGISQR